LAIPPDLDRPQGVLLLSHPIGAPNAGLTVMSMAKSRRVTKKTGTSARKPARGAKRETAARHTARRPSRPPVAKAPAAAAQKVIKVAQPPAPPAPPAPPPRKPTYHEAVAMYERGLQALQRRDFAASADALRTVIERYPDERELLERARLYLKVCERELEPKEPTPKTADEWVYAATVALNAGDETTAQRHLQRALAEDSRHDHAHYMMAVVSARRNDTPGALEHLRQAVSLNPENRSLARQDPDLDVLRDEAAFKTALDAQAVEGAAARAAASKARPKARR
jgi:tetratricopeptide (TPR) repeat protein